MKISPVAATATPVVNPNEGHSYSAERMARAQAIAQGQVPADRGPAPEPEASPKPELSLKRMKMRTQRTVHRELPQAAPPAEAPAVEAPASDTLDSSEQVQGEEATKPLNPQAAAIAKARREVQLERQKIAAERAALEAEKADLAKARDNPSGAYTKDQIKANALGILRDAGVTNDELTQALLNETSDYGPGYAKLESEIKVLKDLLENQNKSLSERDLQTERQVLTQIRSNVDALIAQGEEYETIRETGSAPKVVELIHRTFKKTGEILDEAEAAQLLEAQLVEDSVAQLAKLKKVQSRVLPPAPPAPTGKQPAPNTKVMRTLTNRDGASSISMSKRERAIAAMEGRLK